MKSGASSAILACSILVGLAVICGAQEKWKPAAPVEPSDFQEVAGILAWSYRLPEGMGDDEYPVFEWSIGLEDGSGRVETSNLDFKGLESNDGIKIFLWVEDLIKMKDPNISEIRYCIKSRSDNGEWKKREGQLKLPKGFQELYGFMSSGPADNAWFMMLINSENDKESAFLNLRYAALD